MDHKNGPQKGGTAAIRGKDDDKKLFVGGLPKPCGEREIRDVFSKFGGIESINIKLDPYTGASRGFCFIVFSDANVVDKILSSETIYINGKKIEPRKVTKSNNPGKLFIGGITPDFTEESLKSHFGQYGTITELQWPVDKMRNQRKPYCFITFDSREVVTELLKNPKQTINGKAVDVKRVKYNPDTMWGQGAVQGSYQAAPRPRGYPAAAAYSTYSYNPNYNYEYPAEYATYDDYYGYEQSSDPYYAADPYAAGYECEYAPSYSTAAYVPRAPRGGRSSGSYTRHAPY